MDMEQQKHASPPRDAAMTAAAAEQLIRIKAVQIDPNHCPLSAPLALTIPFALAAPVPGAFWSLVYEADISAKRHKIPLHTTAPKDLAAGDSHVFHEAIQSIPTEGVKEKYLLQVGMLKLELFSASARTEPLASINMVTQVSKDDQGVLRRNIISPLEE
jgi:hypothetical protein